MPPTFCDALWRHLQVFHRFTRFFSKKRCLNSPHIDVQPTRDRDPPTPRNGWSSTSI